MNYDSIIDCETLLRAADGDELKDAGGAKRILRLQKTLRIEAADKIARAAITAGRAMTPAELICAEKLHFEARLLDEPIAAADAKHHREITAQVL